MKIIVDVMGGDHAPKAQIQGALMAAREFRCGLIFVGDRAKIEPVLRGENTTAVIYEIEHTPTVLETCDDPFWVVKDKKDSSMSRALELLRDGKGDCMVSSGNTGALLCGAQLITRRIRGVRRAALAPILPTKRGGALLIDCGATADCTVEYLEQFALMGSRYLSFSQKIENPKVGLLNNGGEASKGDDLRKEAYRRLSALGEAGAINFGGNVEARDVTEGEFDVICTDGFTGNILMKGMEGMGLYISGLMKGMFHKNIFTKLCGLLLGKQIKELKAQVDYKEVGGAPLIGVDHAIIKAHGSADAYAFRSAIRQAIEYKEAGFIEAMQNAFEKANRKKED